MTTDKESRNESKVTDKHREVAKTITIGFEVTGVRSDSATKLAAFLAKHFPESPSHAGLSEEDEKRLNYIESRTKEIERCCPDGISPDSEIGCLIFTLSIIQKLRQSRKNESDVFLTEKGKSALDAALIQSRKKFVEELAEKAAKKWIYGNFQPNAFPSDEQILNDESIKKLKQLIIKTAEGK